MTTPHDRITTSQEYAHWYQHYIAQGDTSDDAARNAYAVTAEAVAKRKRTTNRTLAIVAATIGLIGATIAVAVVIGPHTNTGVRRTVTAPQVPAAEPPPPSPMTYTPVPTDFTVAVTIIKRSCFGEAGCNVEFRIAPTYTGLPLDEGQEWLVTYSVAGGDDGPQINNFTMRGATASFQSEEFASTKSAKVPLTATVTAVAPN